MHIPMHTYVLSAHSAYWCLLSVSLAGLPIGLLVPVALQLHLDLTERLPQKALTCGVLTLPCVRVYLRRRLCTLVCLSNLRMYKYQRWTSMYLFCYGPY